MRLLFTTSILCHSLLYSMACRTHVTLETKDSAVENTDTAIDSPMDTGSSIDSATDSSIFVDSGDSAITPPPPPDLDGDGYGEDVDCDETNPAIHPNAPDFCADNMDMDCDGTDGSHLCDLAISPTYPAIHGTEAQGFYGSQVKLLPILPNNQEAFLITANRNAGGKMFMYTSDLSNYTVDTDAEFVLEAPGSLLFGTNIIGATPERHADINGDGIDDIVLTAPTSDNSIGQVHVILGPIETQGQNYAILQDWIDTGKAYSLYMDSENDVGRAVELYDINADGLMDVLVGSMRWDENGVNAGAVHIRFGTSTIPTDRNLQNSDIILLGEEASDLFGGGIRYITDVNGDGLDDLAISSHRATSDGTDLIHAGKAYVFLAPFTNLVHISQASAVINGDMEYGYLAHTIRSIGDINGDGHADIFLGASGYMGTGAGFLIPGGNIETCSVSDCAFARIFGESQGDQFSRASAGLGDINHDGFDDFAIGAKTADVNGEDSGALYIYQGPLAGDYTASMYHGRLAGESANLQAGAGVALLGDIDGGGTVDFIVGSRYNTDNVGIIYLVTGESFFGYDQ